MRKYLSHRRSIIVFPSIRAPRRQNVLRARLARGRPRTGDTPRALRYFDGRMLTPSAPPRETEVFDAIEVAAELERLAGMHAGNERELRLAVSPPHQGRADAGPRRGRATC